MSTKLISMAALFGVAAFACPGLDGQHQKRADGAIGMFIIHHSMLTIMSNNLTSMVLR